MSKQTKQSNQYQPIVVLIGLYGKKKLLGTVFKASFYYVLFKSHNKDYCNCSK